MSEASGAVSSERSGFQRLLCYVGAHRIITGLAIAAIAITVTVLCFHMHSLLSLEKVVTLGVIGVTTFTTGFIVAWLLKKAVDHSKRTISAVPQSDIATSNAVAAVGAPQVVEDKVLEETKKMVIDTGVNYTIAIVLRCDLEVIEAARLDHEFAVQAYDCLANKQDATEWLEKAKEQDESVCCKIQEKLREKQYDGINWPSVDKCYELFKQDSDYEAILKAWRKQLVLEVVPKVFLYPLVEEMNVVEFMCAIVTCPDFTEMESESFDDALMDAIQEYYNLEIEFFEVVLRGNFSAELVAKVNDAKRRFEEQYESAFPIDKRGKLVSQYFEPVASFVEEAASRSRVFIDCRLSVIEKLVEEKEEVTEVEKKREIARDENEESFEAAREQLCAQVVIMAQERNVAENPFVRATAALVIDADLTLVIVKKLKFKQDVIDAAESTCELAWRAYRSSLEIVKQLGSEAVQTFEEAVQAQLGEYGGQRNGLEEKINVNEKALIEREKRRAVMQFVYDTFDRYAEMQANNDRKEEVEKAFKDYEEALQQFDSSIEC